MGIMVSKLKKTFDGSDFLNPRLKRTSGNSDYIEKGSKLQMKQGYVVYTLKTRTMYPILKIRIPLVEQERRDICKMWLSQVCIWESADV